MDKSIAKEIIQITDKVYIAFKKIPKNDLLEIEKFIANEK